MNRLQIESLFGPRIVPTLRYHLDELEIVQDRTHPQRIVPLYACKGWSVLDVGCGMGQTLTAHEFEECVTRAGVDVDAFAIEAGKRFLPWADLRVSTAESTSFDANSFDLVFSRVAIPYTNIPVAIREIFRLTKPGGHIWLSLHSWEMEKVQLLAAIRGVRVKRLLDRIYVLINSLLFLTFGHCFRRPWSNETETFQFERRMKACLEGTGFANIVFTRDRHFLVVARKPPI